MPVLNENGIVVGSVLMQDIFKAGVSDKLSKLQEVATTLEISAEEIAYIGDYVNDLDCIRWCGLTACPADAVPVVRKAVNYVCERNGGSGAVREFIDKFVSGIE